jgi:hypothetical protein
MATVNRNFLYQLVHPRTNVIMQFSPFGTSVSSEFSRPGTTYVLPGTNSPVDAIGDAPNAMAGRTLVFTFIRPYNVNNDGSLETFTEAQDDFKRMVAHGRRMTAVLQTVTGKLRYGRVKLLSLPDKPSENDDVAAVFSATFDLNPPYWSDLYPESAVIYDVADITYDLGTHVYDDDGYHVSTMPLTIQIDRTAATLPDFGATFAFYGPLGGSSGFRFTNNSINPHMMFTVPTALAANQMLVIECSTESVRLNAVPRSDLLVLPAGQFDVMMFESGIVNNCLIENLGTGGTSGGYITIDTVNTYA